MAERQRGVIAVMATLILVQVLVAGPGIAMIGVFLTPLIHAFHWSHEQVSELAFASTLAGGLIAPLVGYLMDRIGGRWVMSAGMVVMCAAYWAASMLHSLAAMRIAFAIFGAGLMLAGVVPVMVVFVNWFGRRRGTAGGVLWLAFGIGLTVPPPLLTWIIANHGWRIGMRWMSAPIALVVLPLTLLFMRTRPEMAQARTVSEEVEALPGLELWPALSSAMFWLVAAADMLYSCGFGSVFVHQITYLIGLGYSAEHSALVFSAQTLASSIGALVLGTMADRIGARRILWWGLLVIGLGILAFTGAGSSRYGSLSVGLFVIGWGFPAGCVPPLLPVLLAETTGLRRLGTLTGIIRFGASIGTAFGPVLAGMIFDLYHSYVPAFDVAALLLVAAALAVVMVRPATGHDAVPAEVRQAAVS